MTAFLVTLLACNPKVKLPPPAPPGATVVSLQTTAVTTADKESILRTVATASVTPCFEALLLRAPTAFGEVLVRFTIAPDGTVSDARPDFATGCLTTSPTTSATTTPKPAWPTPFAR